LIFYATTRVRHVGGSSEAGLVQPVKDWFQRQGNVSLTRTPDWANVRAPVRIESQETTYRHSMRDTWPLANLNVSNFPEDGAEALEIAHFAWQQEDKTFR
jgi:hypothetical protein